jgi:hypothetical protein
MNKAVATRLSSFSSDLQRAEEALAETQRILKELEREQKRHPLPKRRKVSIVDEVKAILGIK